MRLKVIFPVFFIEWECVLLIFFLLFFFDWIFKKVLLSEAFNSKI